MCFKYATIHDIVMELIILSIFGWANIVQWLNRLFLRTWRIFIQLNDDIDRSCWKTNNIFFSYVVHSNMHELRLESTLNKYRKVLRKEEKQIR